MEEKLAKTILMLKKKEVPNSIKKDQSHYTLALERKEDFYLEDLNKIIIKNNDKSKKRDNEKQDEKKSP